MVHHSKEGYLSAPEIDRLWAKISEKQKKKYMTEHKKKQDEYVLDFEKFVRVS
jgi:hypothetical protein